MPARQELLSEMEFALKAAYGNLENVAQKVDQYEKNPGTLQETNRLNAMGTEHNLYSAMGTLDSCMRSVDAEKSRLLDTQKGRYVMTRPEGPEQVFNGVSELNDKPRLDSLSQRLNEKAEQTPQQADRSVSPQELER